MQRRLSRKSLLVSLGAPLAAAAAPAIALAATYTMRLGLPETAASVLGLVSVHFAQALERRSGGQLKIEVYPGGQLASQQDTVDGLVTGVIDLAVQGAAYEQTLVPQLQAYEMPFLFKNINAGYRVIDGPIGASLFGALEAKGVYGMGSAGSFRELWTNGHPIVVPEDMKGLRVRISGGAVSAAAFQALGGIPVPINTNEAYTALSQHIVDGIDINVDGFTTSKFYTVVKRSANTNQSLAFNLVLGSKRKIDALPAPLQQIVKDEGRRVNPYWRSLIVSQTAADMQVLKNNGVTFDDVQYPAFRKAVDPVYAMMQSKIGGDLLDRISRAAGTV